MTLSSTSPLSNNSRDEQLTLVEEHPLSREEMTNVISIPSTKHVDMTNFPKS
jgi:hypothetical protein